MFGTLKSKLKEFGDKLSEDASKLGGKLASIDPSDIVDPGHKFGVLWEMSENIEHCRECGNKFQHLIKRKHHCRLCAGVFCDNCCPIMESSNGEERRICIGCFRGESPSEKIQSLIRSQIELEREKNNDGIVEKLMDKAASKVTETIRLSTTNSTVYTKYIPLRRGSMFPDDKKYTSPIQIPQSGYFEFANKSTSFCCIKLLKMGNDQKFEVPRPSYVAVPPGEIVSGVFDSNEEGFDLFLLHENMYPTINLNNVIYDTRAKASRKELISPCARVDEFNKISLFSFECKQRNIMIKYKGGQLVLPREGNSINRVGLLGKLQGKKSASNKLDYTTNIDKVRLIFTYSV